MLLTSPAGRTRSTGTTPPTSSPRRSPGAASGLCCARWCRRHRSVQVQRVAQAPHIGVGRADRGVLWFFRCIGVCLLRVLVRFSPSPLLLLPTAAWHRPARAASAQCAAASLLPQGPLVVYNAHLEVFCGLLARIAQLSDIFADARRQADRGYQQQAILGQSSWGWAGLHSVHTCQQADWGG